jgi:hypothetical protein
MSKLSIEKKYNVVIQKKSSKRLYRVQGVDTTDFIFKSLSDIENYLQNQQIEPIKKQDDKDNDLYFNLEDLNSEFTKSEIDLLEIELNNANNANKVDLFNIASPKEYPTITDKSSIKKVKHYYTKDTKVSFKSDIVPTKKVESTDNLYYLIKVLGTDLILIENNAKRIIDSDNIGDHLELIDQLEKELNTYKVNDLSNIFEVIIVKNKNDITKIYLRLDDQRLIKVKNITPLKKIKNQKFPSIKESYYSVNYNGNIINFSINADLKFAIELVNNNLLMYSIYDLYSKKLMGNLGSITSKKLDVAYWQYDKAIGLNDQIKNISSRIKTRLDRGVNISDILTEFNCIISHKENTIINSQGEKIKQLIFNIRTGKFTKRITFTKCINQIESLILPDIDINNLIIKKITQEHGDYAHTIIGIVRKILSSKEYKDHTMLTTSKVVTVDGIRDLKNRYKFLIKVCLPKMILGEWANKDSSLAYKLIPAKDKTMEQIAEYIANKRILVDNILTEDQLKIESSYHQRFFTFQKVLVNVTV